MTQNPVDPATNIALWRLEIAGLVQRAGSYTYEEVQKLPSTSRPITLECIANGPNIGLMSTAIWQGVTLKTLLAQHGGALPGARYVAFYSVDGYTASLPLDEVLEADALLAWRMNGAELPQRHGFPMRVLIPGRYGEENPKWLTRIELTDHFVGGLYSDQGWYNGPLHTTSRIDSPLPGEHVAVGICGQSWYSKGRGEYGWWQELECGNAAAATFAGYVGAVELAMDAAVSGQLYAGGTRDRWDGRAADQS